MAYTTAHVASWIPAVLMLAGFLTPRASGQEFVCALSDNQAEFSIKAFAQLAPIFKEPRCFNCHGGVNPFNQDEPKHPVDAMPFFVLPSGAEDFDKTFHQCQECHGNFPGWRLAPKVMQFKGDTTDLCILMKKQFPGDASSFIAHMTNDRGDVPFLDVAFAGTRGLNQDGKDALMHGSIDPDPPHMSRADMLKSSFDWVDAMGSKFHHPHECGCVDMKYALRITAHGTLQMPGFLFQLMFDKGGIPDIPLHFQDDGKFSADTVANADTRNSGALVGVSCAGDRQEQVGVSMNGSWPDIQTQHAATGAIPGQAGPPKNKIKVKVSLNQLQSDATETCSIFGRTANGANTMGRQSPYQFELALDPVENATQPVPWRAPMPGWSGEVQATIIRIK